MLQILETHKKHKEENVTLAGEAKSDKQNEFDDMMKEFEEDLTPLPEITDDDLDEKLK